MITQGDTGTTFYLLAEGKVRIRVDGEQVALLDSGAFFGEQALITAQRRNADVIAAGGAPHILRREQESERDTHVFVRT